MKTSLVKLALFFALMLTGVYGKAQSDFYLGADLSYVNEMDDCGVRYKEDGTEKDPYAIFADAGANLVRLRLWHTPSWHDGLNDGNRYSDFADIKRSIARAKEQGMDVLLDFHLSDTWADPGRQIVPAAWAGVVNDLPKLQDSLYNYVYSTLMALDTDSLLPDMVQIGNETNKGIMQSEAADAAGWALDWPRNAALFNRGIKAVRDVESATGKDVKVAIHVAGPNSAGWIFDGFQEYGVTDFDVIGLSYYWAWHQPTTMQGAGDIVSQLKADYPAKEVLIFETGYIWTNESNDTAGNIISSVQSGYAPASPANQRRWLIDLTQEMISQGAAGVIYWEPAWVSSTCRTQWGQGSHQEHATFFDFDNNVLVNGGMDFYSHEYDGLVSAAELPDQDALFRVLVRPDGRELTIIASVGTVAKQGRVRIVDLSGRTVLKHKLIGSGEIRESIALPELPNGIYAIELHSRRGRSGARKFLLHGD
ncbi:MAG: arabinogalactan endo-1,4-beta-galactosidase [Neolewinella sp.]|jgi:arabinogalactan endo-1,4-beta-galactosidase